MAVSSTTDLLRQALALHRSGAVAEAEAHYAEVLEADPANADAHYYLGMISCQSGHFAEGAARARLSLAGDPQHARAHVLLGRALSALGQNEEALSSFDRAISLAPELAQAHGNRGSVLAELGRNAEAIESYDRALALAPDSVADWFDRAVALVADGRHGDAISSFDRAIAGKPDFAQARLQRAKVLADLGRHDEALAGVDQVLAAEPELAEAWLGRGNVLTEMTRYAEALEAFDRALVVRPDLASAWLGRGNIFVKLKRRADAFAAFDRAFDLKPDLNYVAGARLHSKLHICDWDNLEAEVTQLLAMIRAGQLASVPFTVFAVPSSPADQLQSAERYVREKPVFAPLQQGEVYSHDRIRVAYLSADFYEHATAYLTAGLFERHDRSRFETFGISFGPDDDSKMRRRIKGAFEHFADVRLGSDQEIADLMRRQEIDIAVDLKGFTADNRSGVLARRAAPIQVNYLGYPGTMGARYIDYILADSTIVPDDERRFYAEEVVWLPDSYQINDNRREIPEHGKGRSDWDLPETAFVFCSFNDTYKITPEMFDVWTRVLQAVDNSVLWLLEGNSAAAANLRREAEKRGVASQRLIFAPRVSVAEHLARHRLADLFLDTLPVNAHTSASDALWTGLPVLTCLGEAFAGRVAGSLLRAAGLDELVTRSLAEYQALAVKLACEPSHLGAVRDRLARNRKSCPLFDTGRTTRQIEAAYTTMWEYHRSRAGHR